jgi:hypothetical protein
MAEFSAKGTATPGGTVLMPKASSTPKEPLQHGPMRSHPSLRRVPGKSKAQPGSLPSPVDRLTLIQRVAVLRLRNLPLLKRISKTEPSGLAEGHFLGSQ